MDIELTHEELAWMLVVYRGEFRIIPCHVVRRVIALGLGVPNLGGAFNLTLAGREVVHTAYFFDEPYMPETEQVHIVRSESRSCFAGQEYAPWRRLSHRV
ncbi:hypothetical protein EJD96_09805 [Herbaspirillum seropedicae]|uniref:hypothetical protein n=1 Tax=Herbaspirillum seropedicae TaxID=964 RepID=UPI00111DEEF0|nr:hypothetical protein [Herbaspirillum seropedicae]QDD64433.1 hypothetical protein EJD96_09805 [Herbaspirillum seropedicae]